jgi:hypothetical protein
LSRIINFNQAKIAHAFEQFAKDSVITDNILENIVPHFHFQSDINDVLNEYSDRDRKRYFEVLQDMKNAVKQMTSEDNMSVRFSLEDEYFDLLQNLETNNTKYKIPSILIKYRKDINPIRALKFELQEIMSMYEVEDDYHLWLIDQYKNEDRVYEIINAVKNDMIKIAEMQKKYLYAKKKHSYFVLPMSYYHCIEMETDMKSWIKTLQEFLVWSTQDDIKNRYD